ncbi:MAG: hypothetical protein WD030_10915 [Pirellulales bacterium]
MYKNANVTTGRSKVTSQALVAFPNRTAQTNAIAINGTTIVARNNASSMASPATLPSESAKYPIKLITQFAAMTIAEVSAILRMETESALAHRNPSESSPPQPANNASSKAPNRSKIMIVCVM